MVVGGTGGGALVICNGGMWGRLAGAGYSLSHPGKKEREGQEEREGLGGVGPLSKSNPFSDICGMDVVFQWPIFNSRNSKLSLLKAILLNKLLTNSVKV